MMAKLNKLAEKTALLQERLANIVATNAAKPPSEPSVEATPAPATEQAPTPRRGNQLTQVHMFEFSDANAKLREELAAANARLTEAIIADLVEVPGRRHPLTPDQYRELKNNLAKNPLIHPIIVRRLADGKLELIAGHNRSDAYRDLGRATITAYVVDFNDDQAERSAFYSNLLQPSLTDFSKYLGFSRRKKLKGFTNVELADEAGISPTLITFLFSFEKLPSAALAALEQHPEVLGATQAQKFAALASNGKGDAVVSAIRELCTGSVSQTAALALANGAKVSNEGSQVIKLKRGRSRFCEINVRRQSVTVKFETEHEAAAYTEAARKMLEQMAGDVEKGS